MPTPRRQLTALALSAALSVGALPLSLFAAPSPIDGSIVAPFAVIASAPVAPGVTHDDGAMSTTSGAEQVHVVTVDPATPGILIQASLSNDRVSGLETVSSQAARHSSEGHRVVAAINGDVWAGYSNDMENAPNGVHIQDGELVTTASSGRPTFGVDSTGHAQLANVVAKATLTTPDGARFVINRVNQVRHSGEIVMYTPRFGSNTSSAATGVDVVVSGLALPITPTGTWTGAVMAVRNAHGSWPIDPGTVVITGPSDSSIRFLAPGQPVSITTSITAGWEGVTQAVGGREWIIRNGVVDVSSSTTASQRHPRSAIGVTADGRVVMVAVDGRQEDSSGVTLYELADLMMSQGVVTAINLDGGGSATLAARQPGDVNASVVNDPSDGSERAVTNSIQVVSTIPTGPLALLTVVPGTGTLYERNSLSLRVVGQDAAYNPVPIDSAAVTWSVDAPIGTVDASGRFVATAVGSGNVVAQVSGLQGRAAITVQADSSPPTVPAPSVSFPPGGQVTSTVPVTVAWDAGRDVGSGLASYELQYRQNGGVWSGVGLGSALARSASMRLERSATYQFRTRAVDKAGNAGNWSTSGAFNVLVLQETAGSISYHGHWDKLRSVNYDGGAARSTAVGGAWARIGFTSSAVGLIVARRPDRSGARLYVDGGYAGVISYAAPKAQSGYLLVTRSWSSPGRHTLELRNLATRGRPRMDVDAYVILQPVGSPPPAPNPTPTPTPSPTPTPPPAPTPSPSPGTSPSAPASGSAVLVGAGDIASCGVTGDGETASAISSIAGDVFMAGDGAYDSGTAAQYRDCYGPTWGTFISRTHPAPGNHDYQTTGAAGYYAYFGSRAGTAGQGWYAYDAGSWRVYSLNSNCGAVGCAAGSAQEQWLAADLAANPRTCVAAVWHAPAFSSGSGGNSSAMRAMWNDLYAAHAELIINAHDDDYERFAPQTPAGAKSTSAGIREFVVGTGGAPLQPFGTIRANSEVRDFQHPRRAQAHPRIELVRVGVHPGRCRHVPRFRARRPATEDVRRAASAHGTPGGGGSCHSRPRTSRRCRVRGSFARIRASGLPSGCVLGRLAEPSQPSARCELSEEV